MLSKSADEAHRDLCEGLRRLQPGQLPRDVFQEVARLMVTVTFVIVPLMERQGRLFALLNRRDADDLTYASMLNPPGTVIRPGDESLAATYRRLMSSELPGTAVMRGPVFVGNVYDQITRGREVSLVHWVELDEPAPSSDLYDVAWLPDDVIATDQPRIAMAAAHFREHRFA